MSPAPEKIRVLFVEDEVDQALLVQTFFAGLGGFAVTHIQDGDQALRLVEERDWDLLVADLNLPGADGFQVMRAARAKNRHLPILATTGYTQEHYWDQAFRSGANQVMVKPLHRDEFLDRVRSMLGPIAAEVRPRERTRDAVLVIEGLPGDGLMGCGGTAAIAAKAGARVVVLPVATDAGAVSAAEIDAARESARALGATLRVAESMVGDVRAMAGILEGVVDELRPSIVYAPAGGDSHPARATASRIAVEATLGRTNVYGYQTATSPATFRPRRMVDVGKQMSAKLEALERFREVAPERKDMDPDMALAYARYWGRLKDFGQVEVFEIIQEKKA